MTDSLKDLRGKTLFITGASRGIGLAIGQWFLANGHQVVLLDVDSTTLDATQKQLSRPGDVLCLHTDVSQPDQVQAAADLDLGSRPVQIVGQRRRRRRRPSRSGRCWPSSSRDRSGRSTGPVRTSSR